jgi:hypothetical protein
MVYFQAMPSQVSASLWINETRHPQHPVFIHSQAINTRAQATLAPNSLKFP